jgi:hypothetical protein
MTRRVRQACQGLTSTPTLSFRLGTSLEKRAEGVEIIFCIVGIEKTQVERTIVATHLELVLYFCTSPSALSQVLQTWLSTPRNDDEVAEAIEANVLQPLRNLGSSYRSAEQPNQFVGLSLFQILVFEEKCAIKQVSRADDIAMGGLATTSTIDGCALGRAKGYWPSLECNARPGEKAPTAHGFTYCVFRGRWGWRTTTVFFALDSANSSAICISAGTSTVLIEY